MHAAAVAGIIVKMDAALREIGGAPDWPNLRRELTCPLCEYNLRGLVEPRCPECGYAFKWAEIVSEQPHPYLFEHHHRRNLWSFARTLIGSLRPRKFWRTLTASHHPKLRRLLLYWVLVAGMLMAAPVVKVGLVARGLAVSFAYGRQSVARYIRSNPSDPRVVQQLKRWGSAQAFLDSRYPPVWSWEFLNQTWAEFLGNSRGYFVSSRLSFSSVWLPGSIRGPGIGAALPALLLLVLWPWLTLFTLIIFLTSMQRSQIKWVHVMRCVLYSADVMWVAAIAGLLTNPRARLSVGQYEFAIGGAGIILCAVGLLAALLMGYRLAVAYRLYLRFPHGIAVALATQVIVLLLVLVVALNWTLLRRLRQLRRARF